MSNTITFRVDEQEKKFIKTMATFNGMSLSELVRTKLLEALEEQADYNDMVKLMAEHDPSENISLTEMKRELGL
ncbi:MAG: DUF6290 family protein [Lactobacillales bacterium]|jgi:uncharacterized protein (DUF1778 family)|nr:DUF6290 family protein [Lactobacillales bacterium]